MEPVTAKSWRQRCHDHDVSAAEFASSIGIPLSAAEILVRRGFSQKDVHDYFHASLKDLPEPNLLPGMERAARRLADAVVAGEKIVIHGDYDVDGITGTALLVEFLRDCGAEVDYFIPLRLKDGYGLSAEAVERAHRSGCTLMVSVDCGISAHHEAALARDLGLDLVITDHHQPGEGLPHAVAVVNPQLEPCSFPDRNLSGAGVAFFLAVATRRDLRDDSEYAGSLPDLRDSLDLVALGTVADVVPLQFVNRLLVRKGLDLIKKPRRPGIRALLDVAGIRRVTCGSVGFQLAPRLNAAGRLEDASLGVELLLCRAPSQAADMARRLDLFNRERREIEESTLTEALQMVSGLEDQRRSIVLWSEGWHSGVIGIVASRLVEKFHRPTLMIACEPTVAKGSARSVSGFHLYRALEGCRDALEGFGGHAMAAGFSLLPENLKALDGLFESLCRDSEVLATSLPHISYDIEVDLPQLSEDLVLCLENFSPFGAGNPEPLFLLRGIHVQQLQPVNGGHVRFLARQDGQTMPCIAFAFQQRVQDLQGEVDLLVAPQINRWNGRSELQLVVRDVRPHAGGVS